MRLNKEYIDYLKKQNILIVGAAPRSGVSIANTLFDLGIEYTLSDNKSKEELKESIDALKNKHSNFFFKNQDINILKDVTLIIISPGVPREIPLIKEAYNKNVKVIGEIEFAYRLIPDNKYIAITGTDGKTTTTTLTYEIIKSYKDARLVGNVGNTFSKDVENIKKNEIIILELSSFQLETIELFHPNTAAILNIAQDHLDRYSSIETYFEAKKHIYKNQNKYDFLILNFDNIYTNSIIEKIENTNVMTFSAKNKKATIYVDDEDNIYYKNEKLFSIKKRKIIGAHNRENIIASILISINANIPVDIIEKIVNNFNGLSHRTELVDVIKGVSYINDSKATSMTSVLNAIKSFDKNIILIMGGYYKGINFSPLSPIIKERVKCLILTGEARNIIDEMITFDNKIIIKDFDKAFNYAKKISKKGDTVLLSPGCASYDRFKNYEERGEHFKNLVKNISK